MHGPYNHRKPVDFILSAPHGFQSIIIALLHAMLSVRKLSFHTIILYPAFLAVLGELIKISSQLLIRSCLPCLAFRICNNISTDNNLGSFSSQAVCVRCSFINEAVSVHYVFLSTPSTLGNSAAWVWNKCA